MTGDEYCSLLGSLLGRHIVCRDELDDEVRELLQAVDASFRDFEGERAMLERSLVLSSEELLQANAELHAVFKEVPDLFIWFDGDGVVLRVEGTSEPLLPTPDQLCDHPEFASTRDRTLAGRNAELVELELSAGAGAQFYEARFIPLLRDQVFAVVRNITERKRGEHALGEEKERLATTLRSIGDAVLTTDIQGRIDLFNRAAEQLTGWGAAAAVGAPLAQVLNLGGVGEHASIAERIELITTTGVEWLVNEVPLRSRSGGPRTVDLRAAPIEDGPAIVGVVVVFRDVSERVRLVDERLRASKLESLGILAGGIAHDFNNILQSLLGSISLAEHRLRQGRDISALLTRARRASQRARDLTKQLLAVSKGGAPVKDVASARELLVESSTFAARGVDLRCDYRIADDLGAIEVDQGQMSQVIQNLVINAAQAMAAGGVAVIGAENAGDEVRIWVSDNGSGISEEVLAKIFDPYFTTKETGSGLGLYTAYVIVRRHDGRIEVNSRIGEGTTFSIFLPRSYQQPDAITGEQPLIGGGRGRVLVVDDEEEVLDVTREMLRQLGYTVETAREGREAVSLFREAQGNGRAFRLAMLDLTIPGGQGGADTVRQLGRLDGELTVVAMTGYANDEIVTAYREHGFDAVLVKPFSVGELDRTLHSGLMAASAAPSD